MSKRSFIGLGGLLCAGLVALAGCMPGDVSATANVDDYDTSALDTYLSDARDVTPFAKSKSKKNSYAKTVSRKTNSHSERSKQSKNANVSHDGFYGDWVAKIDMGEAMDKESKADNVDSEMGEMGEQFAEAMAEAFGDMMAMSLSLHKDHTFEMEMMFMPVEGTWKQKRDSLILTPNKIMGLGEEEAKEMSAQMGNGSNGSAKFEPLELRITENGDALVAASPDSSDDQELVFRRK